MHNTLSPNFKGFIDNFHINNGNIRISGWLFSDVYEINEVTYHLDIGKHPIVFYAQNERQDVQSFYKSTEPKHSLCGFDISIPYDDNQKYQIYAMAKGQKEVLFNLSVKEDYKQIPEPTHIDESTNITFRSKIVPDVIVVDNFYNNPDEVRNIALAQSFEPDLRYHKGKRTQKRFLPDGLKQTFESLIGAKITNWANYEYNGVFQYCTAQDPLVYHSDVQRYAAAIYLTPDAPATTGTSFFRSKESKVNKVTTNDANYNEVFKGGFYDRTKFEHVDTVGNIYNRLVMWNAHYIHSASEYFGTEKEDSRLFHLFFFDIEE